MISNGRQRKVNMEFIEKFTGTIEELEAGGNVKGLHPLVFKAGIDGLKAKRAELQAEVDEYERIRSSDPRSYELDGFEAALSSLAKLRISLGMGEAELAGMVGLEELQITKYESAGYKGARAEQIMAIIGALRERAGAAAPRPA